uniref:PNPLA domain-containing protein n=1 Tax=Panagrellus redivivus TaxID=6233 RepID=A0A7E4UR30_PANRE
MMLTASGLPKLTTLHKHAVVAVRFATNWRDWMTILSQGPANSLDDVEKVERIRSSERNVEPGASPNVPITTEKPKGQEHVAIDIPNASNDELALSLSGCGFLGSYHFGVMICFRNNAKKFMSRVTRIAGASGGSLVAACYAMCPDQLEASLERLYSLADELNSLTFGALTPGFYLNERLSHIVDNVIPDDLACIQNRLFVSLTRSKDKTNRIVSAYPDKIYLQKCLLASCFIPMYSMGYGAIPPEIDGDSYIDGGITENLPVFKDMNTVTISPFSGSALICPHDQNLFEWKMTLGNQLLKVNMSNVVRGAQALFPPSRATLHAYYEMGYRDGMKFLLNNGYLERAVGTPV